MRGGARHAVSFGSLRAPILPGTGLQDRPPDPVDLLHRVVDRDPLQVAVPSPPGGRGPPFPPNPPPPQVSTRGFPRSAPASRQVAGRRLRWKRPAVSTR